MEQLNEKCRFSRGTLDLHSGFLCFYRLCVFSLWIMHFLPTIVSHCNKTIFKVLIQCICFAFTRHGYARWQYISDDRENGLFEAARRELHLPSVNEIIGAQLNEANVSMCSLCPFLQILKCCISYFFHSFSRGIWKVHRKAKRTQQACRITRRSRER